MRQNTRQSPPAEHDRENGLAGYGKAYDTFPAITRPEASDTDGKTSALSPALEAKLQHLKERRAYLEALNERSEAAHKRGDMETHNAIEERFLIAMDTADAAFFAVMAHPCDRAEHAARAEALKAGDLFRHCAAALTDWDNEVLIYNMAGVPVRADEAAFYPYTARRYVADLEAGGVTVALVDGGIFYAWGRNPSTAFTDARRRAHEAGLTDDAIALYLEVRQSHA